MTIFSPLAPGSHLDARNPPYEHPQENAMSKEQWERVANFFMEASKKLDIIADLRQQVDELTIKSNDALKENVALKAAVSKLQAKLTDMEATAAELQKDNAALKEGVEKWSAQALDLQAERDEATKNAIALVANADKKDEEITVLRAQLKQARASTAEADTAKEPSDGDRAAKNKGKGGAAS